MYKPLSRTSCVLNKPSNPLIRLLAACVQRSGGSIGIFPRIRLQVQPIANFALGAASIDADLVMDQVLLRLLYRRARDLAQNSGFESAFIVMIVLAGTLVLSSVLITFLVWLRYLVTAGLITTSAVTAIRWSRRIEGSGDNSTRGLPAVDADTLPMLEHDLDVEGPD